MDNRYVGILVNQSLFERIPSGKTKFEAIKLYEEAGDAYNITPCYFRLQDVKPGYKTIKAYVKTGTRYKRTTVPFPQVIHNRAIYFKQGSYKRLEQLASRGKYIFNFWNRYSKWHIHQLLKKDPSLTPHLPISYKASVYALRNLMNGYNSIIIKPVNSSVGMGIMKLERKGSRWKLSYPVHTTGICRSWRSISFSRAIPRMLVRRITARRYIVQECIPLATYKGSPFDLRVSVQRSELGEWQVTGIVGKVAGKKVFLTNVAQGGKVYKLVKLLEEYPLLSEIEVRDNVSFLALKIAEHLSKYIPELADIGLDIGITSEGFPFFIECNGRDQRYSFLEGGLLDEWRAAYFTPIGYARYLMDES
jgi:hypothetical protein